MEDQNKFEALPNGRPSEYRFAMLYFWLLIGTVMVLAVALPAIFVQEYSDYPAPNLPPVATYRGVPDGISVAAAVESVSGLGSTREKRLERQKLPGSEIIARDDNDNFNISDSWRDVELRQIQTPAAFSINPIGSTEPVRVPGASIETSPILTQPVTIRPVEAVPTYFPRQIPGTPFNNNIGNLGFEALSEPSTDGRAVLARACSGCHTTEFVYRGILAGRAAGIFNRIPGDYADLVARENARGGPVLTTEESQALVNWLLSF